jgi:serine protease Do
MLKSVLMRAAIVSSAFCFLLTGISHAQVSDETSVLSPFVLVGADYRTFLGVGVQEMTSDRAKALNLKEEYGVEVTRVDEDSPAEKAGLQKGDVIIAYNGERIEGGDQFIRMVHETPPGRGVKLTILRNGSQQTVTAVLGSRRPQLTAPEAHDFGFPEMPDLRMFTPDAPRAMMFWRNGMLGVEAEALGDTQLATYFGVKEGVLVRSVVKGTAAEKAGLKAGDVLLKIDGGKVTTPRDVTSAMREAHNNGKKSFSVVIVREHKEMTLPVTLQENSSTTPRMRGTPVANRPPNEKL